MPPVPGSVLGTQGSVTMIEPCLVLALCITGNETDASRCVFQWCENSNPDADCEGMHLVLQGCVTGQSDIMKRVKDVHGQWCLNEIFRTSRLERAAKSIPNWAIAWVKISPWGWGGGEEGRRRGCRVGSMRSRWDPDDALTKGVAGFGSFKA